MDGREEMIIALVRKSVHGVHEFAYWRKGGFLVYAVYAFLSEWV